MKFGAYDFIDKCEQIVRCNDGARSREEAKKQRAEKRAKLSVERVIKQKRGTSVPLEIPIPKYYKNKEIEREKIQELLRERKEKRQEQELQNKTDFKAKRDSHVYIDDTLIDLYDTSENVQAKIDTALK